MFDTKAQEQLGYYVYALFDPREPNWPFYIGKGCGNRIFAHAKGDAVVQSEDEPLSAKLQLIAEIKNAELTVIHKIIRFGLSEEEAFKIEASLIDLVNYIQPETLKNEVSGQGVAEGIYDALDLAFSLSATELKPDRPLLIIKIESQWYDLVTKFGSATRVPRIEIYNATKGAWKISISRAQRAECILAVARGLVRAVFVPSGWEDAGHENRKIMTGESDSMQFDDYVGKSVAHLFVRGSQNPIRYLQSDRRGCGLISEVIIPTRARTGGNKPTGQAPSRYILDTRFYLSLAGKNS